MPYVTICLSCPPHIFGALLEHSSKKTLEGGRGGSNSRGRDPSTPACIEEPAEVWSSGLLEDMCTRWHDALWLHSAGCELRGREWKITAAHTNGHRGESRETWAIWFSPWLIVPITWGNFIPLKITMNFGLRRNGIICHLNVWCVMGKIWKEFEIFLTILNMNNLRFSAASDQINDVTILFIIQPTGSKQFSGSSMDRSYNDLCKANHILWEISSKV